MTISPCFWRLHIFFFISLSKSDIKAKGEWPFLQCPLTHNTFLSSKKFLAEKETWNGIYTCTQKKAIVHKKTATLYQYWAQSLTNKRHTIASKKLHRNNQHYHQPKPQDKKKNEKKKKLKHKDLIIYHCANNPSHIF